jgi:site-specific recombinase XerD
MCLVEMLRRAGVAPAAAQPARELTPRDLLIASFERYLATERGLAAGTIQAYSTHARRFLDGYTPPGGLAALSAGQVMAAVLAESARVGASATRFFIVGLRTFLRFCFTEALVPVDLSEAALSMTGRRPSLLPRGISQAEASALLDNCDRSSPLGRRDFAMLVVLLRLGLRAGEIAALRLEDIDWRSGQLVVVTGKGRRLDRLPLPAEAGAAIAAYLVDGRPAVASRALFVRGRAPFTPIRPGTVSSTVRRACRRAGIAEIGAHRLRHTLACEMVVAGVPLVHTAHVLRHRSLQTTALYARVDARGLRALALPWPGTEADQ